MKCAACKREIIDSAAFCRFCGEKVDPRSSPPPRSSDPTGAVDTYFAKKRNESVAEARELANQEAITGGLWFVAGLIITAVSYSVAPPGGHYYILWGAVVYGFYKLVRGLYYKWTPEELVAKADREAQRQSKK
jgi:hypothetical protein